MTAEQLRGLLSYNRRTGVFRWKVSRRNGVKPGDAAGWVFDGYRRIHVDGHAYLASRLAWLYVKGCWPNSEVDHENGIHDDDRFKNLRDTTHTGNMQNQRKAHSNSKTGLLGVNKQGAKFRAEIWLKGKNRHLGTFATAEAAHAAYLQAKRQYHSTCTI